MTKQDYIKYWTTTAAKDWKVVKQLFEGKSYLHALFWAHLVLEKLLKAHWVKDNEENIPPKIHNLVALARKTALEFNDDDMLFLSKMNDVQLEGRYPDYVSKVYKIYRRKETEAILQKVDELRKCLLKNLP